MNVLLLRDRMSGRMFIRALYGEAGKRFLCFESVGETCELRLGGENQQLAV